MFVMACWAMVASAEDPEFVGAELVSGEEAEKEKPETNLSAELGGVWTTGNAQFYAINGGLTLGHKWDRNKFSALAGVNLGSAVTDGDGSGAIDDAEREIGYTENSRRMFAEARYDRFLSDRDSLYLLAGGFHDIFAGYDLRSHEQFGYSRLLITNDTTELRTEIGFDYAQEFYRSTPEAPVDPDYQNIFAARVLLGLNHAFNESVSVSDTFELYENVLDPADLRMLNTATFSSALSSKLSLKLSHALIFDNVPVEGFRKLDQTSTVTLVATLL